MKALVDLGWADENGNQHLVEKGGEVKDAPAEKVKFWQAVGMVDGKTTPKAEPKK